MLTNQWMGKIAERLVVLYSHAPWQVRATLFGAVVGGLGECAALRHIAPADPLWQQAASGLVSAINAGLPAVNIMFVNYHQPPENAWQIVAGAFEMVLLGWGLPGGLQQQAADETQQQEQQGTRRLSGEGSSSGNSRSRSVDSRKKPSSSSSSNSAKVPEDPAAAESRLQVSWSAELMGYRLVIDISICIPIPTTGSLCNFAAVMRVFRPGDRAHKSGPLVHYVHREAFIPPLSVFCCVYAGCCA